MNRFEYDWVPEVSYKNKTKLEILKFNLKSLKLHFKFYMIPFIMGFKRPWSLKFSDLETEDCKNKMIEILEQHEKLIQNFRK